MAVAFAGLLACDPALVELDADRADAGPRTDGGWLADSSTGADAMVATDASATDAGRHEPVWRHRDVGRGGLPSLEIAPDGVIHIGHTMVFTNGTGQVLYSRSTGSRFETDLVAEGPRLGWNVALALDGADPRIAFADPAAISGGTGQISIATRGGGAWTVEEPPLTDATGWSIALAYMNGSPSVFYEDERWTLARSGAEDWISDAIDIPQTGGVATVAYDPAGVAHVALSRSEEGPTYARRDPDGWSFETIAPPAEASPVLDIEVGPDGNPIIGFSEMGAVRVAERTPDGWTITRVADDADAAEMALTVDPEGVAHLVYSDAESHEVVYASSASGWLPTTLADSGEGPTFVDIAVDADGRPHVAYSVFTPASTLRLAVLE